MKTFFISLIAVGILAAAQAQPAPGAVTTPTPPAAAPTATPTGAEVTSARSQVLELAGAFANDGYKVRDGFWTGRLEPGKPQQVVVNLFAGNEYWFSAAALPPAGEIAVKVFDENGKLVESQTYQDGLKVATGVESLVSGKYFVQVQLLKGDASEFCLIYSYK